MLTGVFMKKKELEAFISKGCSIREIALEMVVSPTTVRYWLEKHSLKTKPKIKKQKYKELTAQGLRYCTACELTLKIEMFYLRSNGKPMSWCKSCANEASLLRQQELKQQAVAYKGGSCEDCGYNRCLAALEFHHLDPAEKDPSWASMKMWSFDRVKPELDKCALLCANCHRERHHQYAACFWQV